MPWFLHDFRTMSIRPVNQGVRIVSTPVAEGHTFGLLPGIFAAHL